MLYEMLSGALPFFSESIPKTYERIVNHAVSSYCGSSATFSKLRLYRHACGSIKSLGGLQPLNPFCGSVWSTSYETGISEPNASFVD